MEHFSVYIVLNYVSFAGSSPKGEVEMRSYLVSELQGSKALSESRARAYLTWGLWANPKVGPPVCSFHRASGLNW